MLTRSSKSVRSIRSLGSSEINTAGSDLSQVSVSDEPTSYVFEVLLPFVCKKFHCEFDLYVKKDFLQEDVQRYKLVETPVSYKRIGMITPSSIQMPKKAKSSVASEGVCRNYINVRALYDSNDYLVEVLFLNQPSIPRLLMQALAVVAPLYENVSRFTIRRCEIDSYTIYELNKLVFLMNLTDVYIDDSFLPEANYAILLEKKSSIRQLSLCRCSINDLVCQQICKKLCYPAPAANNLLILHLSGNRITDEGAKYVAEMLRSNRCLRYLNLANNHIGDDGAKHIFDALMQFPLTYDEIVEKRRRIFTYLKRKRELIRKLMNECELATGFRVVSTLDLDKNKERSISVLKNSTLRSKTQLREKLKMVQNKEQAKEQAEIVAIELIGELRDPFFQSYITVKEEWPYCNGNLILSSLNLSYNNLTYFSVKKILNLLEYQSTDSGGLFRIIFNGNPIPVSLPEYQVISEFLNKKLNVHGAKGSVRRRSRAGASTASTGKK